MNNHALGPIYLSAAGLFSLVALIYCLTISPAYTTDALLIPKEQNNSGQLSGLATATRLLGLSGGVDQGSNFGKFQKYWGSRDVATTILRKYPEFYMELFRGNWDERNHRWYDRPHNLRQYLAIPFNWLFGVYPSFVPTPQDLACYIKDIKPETDPTNSQIQIKFSAADARFAQRFLRIAIAETDDAVRQAERRRDQDFVNFARDRLEHETNVTYRDALTDSLRQFEMSNMYAEAGENFSFQYVEAPSLPTVHSSPRPLLNAILSVIFGNLAAACIVSTMFLWPKGRLAIFVGRIHDRAVTVLKKVLSERFSRRAL